MRLFIGISLDYRVRDYLKAVQDVIKQSSYEGNYTKFDNFHITLRFLGEISSNEIDAMIDAIDIRLQEVSKFTIKIGDIGFFNQREKKLIFVKIIQGQEQLKNLYKNLNQCFNDLDISLKPQKFAPHITIARQVTLNPHKNASTPIPFYPKAILVSSITLFQSERIHGKLTYTPLYDFTLP